MVGGRDHAIADGGAGTRAKPPGLAAALLEALAATGERATLPEEFEEQVTWVGDAGEDGLGLAIGGEEPGWAFPSRVGAALLALGTPVGDAGDGAMVAAFADVVACVAPCGDDEVVVIPCIELAGRPAPSDLAALAAMGGDEWIDAAEASARELVSAGSPEEREERVLAILVDFLAALPGQPLGWVAFGRRGRGFEVVQEPNVTKDLAGLVGELIRAVVDHPVDGLGWTRLPGNRRLASSWRADGMYRSARLREDASAAIAAARIREGARRAREWLATAGIAPGLRDRALAALEAGR